MNMVLAIGAFVGASEPTASDFYYYTQARKHLSVDLLERGSLSLVQAIALMANYLQKRNKPNSGFSYLGVAFNMAQGIGLHREFSEPMSSAFTMEIRRRAWWTLFIFDSGARLTFGRPVMTLSGVNIQMPRNLRDNDLAVDVSLLPPVREVPTVASSLIAQVRLAEIGNLANCKLLEARVPDKVQILDLDDRVKAWRAALPWYFHENTLPDEYCWFEIPRMVLLWRSMHLQIVMNRPFLLDVLGRCQTVELGDPNSPVQRCVGTAQACVRSILSYWHAHETHPEGLTWYATYWLITAAFVDATCLLYAPYHVSAPQWRQEVEGSKVALQEMGVVEPMAERAARMLENILSESPPHVPCASPQLNV